jgi:hypothetical protein
LVVSLHPCLPNIAMLKALTSLKPIPPWNFGRVSSDHRRQCKPRRSTLLLHQKLEVAKVIFWQVAGDRRNQLMEYVGIACATDLIKISRPTQLNSLSPSHPSGL